MRFNRQETSLSKALPPDAMTDDRTLAFELDWPDVRHAQHRVPDIGRTAGAKVIWLWSETEQAVSWGAPRYPPVGPH